MQVKDHGNGVPKDKMEELYSYVKNGDYIIACVKNCFFTKGGHFILIRIDGDEGDGIVKVDDSYSQNVLRTGRNDKKEVYLIEDCTEKYLNGFNFETEIVPYMTSYWVVSGEFRDDGYDYTACPKVDEKYFLEEGEDNGERLIQKYGGSLHKEWVETEKAMRGTAKVDKVVRLSKDAPITYPPKAN